ncbi:MAG TPA: 23S rRNA (uracil(1939)-C(5))-methyltransferase RlmD, partial [Lachnospiraceae bacterium]|nr:23S rRNA (uracil(1939)-C(5))-methyltransferase RlmD [Lachnospiraceae bacterium]
TYIETIMEPIVGMEDPYRYRNKAQYPVGTNREGRIITGFYASRTHSIISNTDCYLGAKENKLILDNIVKYMEECKVSAYQEETGIGLVRHILIRTGFATKEIMVCLVVNGNRLPKEEVLINNLSNIEDMTSVSINTNTENTNVIMGQKIRTLWGSDTITDTISMESGSIAFKISPLSFYQVNPAQTEKLYRIALDYASLTGEETVWDLYCGIGTISLFLASKAKQVYGVEVIPEAIEDAKENARINGIKNAEFFVGKVEEVLPAKYENESIYADVIVVDPPRKGCDEICLATMIKMQPKRIVYVSCDSATLARDLKILCASGYKLEKVRPVDQFGHTVHVETVVLLSQQKPSDRIEVDLDLDEMDVTSAETKSTYAEIKEYILKENGLKVSNLYISQIKRKCGLEVGENYNLAKSEDAKQPNCPEEKEKAIVDAMKHFGMV